VFRFRLGIRPVPLSPEEEAAMGQRSIKRHEVAIMLVHWFNAATWILEVTTGVALSTWLPRGLNATYSVTSSIGRNGVTTTQGIGVGLHYAGRPDLAQGLELDWKFNRLESDQVGEFTLSWINFRYYWN
jgi:hypothetical protein